MITAIVAYGSQIHGISYVSGPFLPAKPRLEATAPMHFDTHKIYTFEDLEPNFIDTHQEIFTYKRGGGYWIWKHHIVLKHLHLINEDDTLVYFDGGCKLYNTSTARAHFAEYVDIVQKDPKGILAFELDGLPEHHWTKQSMVTYLEARYTTNLSQHMLSNQRVGGIFFVRKTPFSVNFFTEYAEIIADDDTVLLDSKEHESPSFKEHRHDQSLFSLLTKIYNVTTLPDMTWTHTDQYPIYAARSRH